MKRWSPRKRVAWLAVLSAAFALWAVALALDWHPGEWISLAIGLLLAAEFWRQHDTAERDRMRWHRTLDAMQAAVALWDRDDRLLFANADFKRLYGYAETELVPGTSFEQVLSDRVAAGRVPAARGLEAAWIAERVAQHRVHASAVLTRQMADGRWRRITEQPLPDGSLLSYSLDVTELVEREHELAQARAEAERAHGLLRDAIEAMPAGIEIYDAADRLVIYNRRLEQLYSHVAQEMAQGQTFEAMVRRSLELNTLPQAVGREAAWLAERLATRGQSKAPLLQQLADGTWLQIHETRGASGSIVGVRLDVTELVRQREALAAAQASAEAATQLLRDAIEALPDGFALFDAADRLVLCNQRYREMYPESAPAIQAGRTFEEIVRYGLERGQYPEAGDGLEAWVAERLRRHRDTDGTPVLQQVSGGHWLRIDERRTRDGGIAGVRTDVTDLMQARQAAESARAEAQASAAALREANAALETLSTTDALTGLANRRRFDQRLQEELQRVQRYNAPLTLLLIDIDYFKRYNDHHGHLQGDRALEAVARVLARQARRPGELAARYGGEEFAILLPHADAQAGLAAAERCQAEIAQLALPHGHSPVAPHVTLSIGVAQWRGAPIEDAVSLLRRADMALYAAKAAGRARSQLAEAASDI